MQCWFNYCSSIIHLKSCNGFVEILFTYHTIHPSECATQWLSILRSLHPSPQSILEHSCELRSNPFNPLLHLPFSTDSSLSAFIGKGLIQYAALVTGFLPSAQCVQGSSTSQLVYNTFYYLVVLPACYSSFSYAKIPWFY